ncbi:MAG: hypothetical protein H0T76_09655, partial [Nannocystis sp.]
MHTICPHCGADLRSGRAPGACEHCREYTSRVATARDEGSGLIDVRAISGMLGASRPTPVEQPLRTGVLDALNDSMPQPMPRPRAPRPSQTQLHVLLGVLVFSAVGLVGAVVHSASETPHAAMKVATAAPMQRSAAFDDADADASPEAVAVEDEDEDEIELLDDIVLLDEPEAAQPPARKRRATSRQRHRPAAPAPTPERAAAASVEPVAAPVPAKKTNERESVACLLNPSECATPQPAKVAPAPAPKANASLPARLELADITSGTRAARTSAT